MVLLLVLAGGGVYLDPVILDLNYQRIVGNRTSVDAASPLGVKSRPVSRMSSGNLNAHSTE